jgi:hypothetical protein
MTTYAPTFTPRLRVKYKAGGISHSIQVRGPRGASLATMGGLVDPVANCFVALATYLFSDFAWISAEVALTDAESFAPVAVSGIIPVGGVTLATQSAIQRIRGLTISGRAPGSRSRFTIFGVVFAESASTDIGADGVSSGAEVAGLVTIAGIANTYFKANSGDNAIWYTRGTYKRNDHLLKLVRRGTII